MANGHYETRRVWHQTSAAGSGYWAVERVWVPGPSGGASAAAASIRAAANAAEKRRLAEAARKAAKRAAALAAARAKTAAQKRAAEIASREREEQGKQYQKHLAEQRAKAVQTLAEKTAARNRQYGIIRDTKPAVASARKPTAPEEIRAAWDRGQPARDKAREDRLAKIPKTRIPGVQLTPDGTKKQIRATQLKMDVAKPADAKRAEKLMAGDLEEIARNGGKLTPDQLNALQQSYEKYADSIDAEFKALTAKMAGFVAIMKNESLPLQKRLNAQTKYRNHYKNQYLPLFHGEWGRLFGKYNKKGILIEPGAYQKFYTDLDQRAIQQREWWKSQVRAQLNRDRHRLIDRGRFSPQSSRAALADDTRFVAEQQRIFNEDPKDLGQTIDHHETYFDPETGQKRTRPIYRPKTIEEALQDQQARLQLEQERLWAESQRERQIAMAEEVQARYAGMERSPTGEWVRREEMDFSREAMGYAERVWGKTGDKVNVPEVKRPQDAQKAVDEIMAQWDKEHPQPKSTEFIAPGLDTDYSMNSLSPEAASWRKERDSFEDRMYQFLGLPGSPIVFERFMTIPVIREVVASLGVPIGLLGAGYRMIAMAGTGGDSTKIGGYHVDYDELPQPMKATVETMTKFMIDWVPGVGALKYDATTIVLQDWLKTPEGRLWYEDQMRQEQAIGNAEMQKFWDVLYGGKAKDAGEWVDTVNEFGASPFADEGQNFLFQMLLDPTNVIPLNFLKLPARVAYTRKLMAGASSVSRPNRWYKAYKGFLEVDEGVLAMEKEMSKYKKQIVASGHSVEEAAEEMRQLILGMKADPEGYAKAFTDFAKKYNLNPRDINPAQIQNLAEWQVSDILKKDKRASIVDQHTAMLSEAQEQARKLNRESRRAKRLQREEFERKRKAAEDAREEVAASKERLDIQRVEGEESLARAVQNAEQMVKDSVRSNTDRARARRAKAEGVAGRPAARTGRAASKPSSRPAWKRAPLRPKATPEAAPAARAADAPTPRVDPVHVETSGTMARAAAAHPPRRRSVPARPKSGYAAHESWMRRFQIIEGEYFPRDPAPKPLEAGWDRGLTGAERAAKYRNWKRSGGDTPMARLLASKEFKELRKRLEDGDETARPAFRAMARQAEHETLRILEDMDLNRQTVRGVPDAATMSFRAGVLGDEEAEAVLLHNLRQSQFMRRRGSDDVLTSFVMDADGRIVQDVERTALDDVAEGALAVGDDIVIAKQGARGTADLYAPFVNVMSDYLKTLPGGLSRIVKKILNGEFIESKAIDGGWIVGTLRDFDSGIIKYPARADSAAAKADKVLEDALTAARQRVSDMKQARVEELQAKKVAYDEDAAKIPPLKADIARGEELGLEDKEMRLLRGRLENLKFSLVEQEKAFKELRDSQIPGLEKAEKAVEEAENALQNGRQTYFASDGTRMEKQYLPGGVEGWRDLGQITFEIFHRLRLSEKAIAHEKLREIGLMVSNSIAAGEVDNLYFWQWKVMEIRAGLPWADFEHEDYILDMFRETAQKGGLVPDLTLSTIPNGYRAQRPSRTFGLSPRLSDIENSENFLPAPAEWAGKGDNFVLDKITEIFTGRGRVDPMQIVHYVAQTAGDLRAGYAFKSRAVSEAIAAARDIALRAAPETAIADLAKVAQKYLDRTDEAAIRELRPNIESLRDFARVSPEDVLTPDELRAYLSEKRVSPGAFEDLGRGERPTPMLDLFRARQAEHEQQYLTRWQKRRYNQAVKNLKEAGASPDEIPSFADSQYSKLRFDQIQPTADEIELAFRALENQKIRDLLSREQRIAGKGRIGEGGSVSLRRPEFPKFIRDALEKAYWKGDLATINDPRVHELMYLLKMQSDDYRGALMGPTMQFAKYMEEIGYRDRAIKLIQDVHATRIANSNSNEMARLKVTNEVPALHDPVSGSILDPDRLEQRFWQRLGLGVDAEKVREASRQRDVIRAESELRERAEAKAAEDTLHTRDKVQDGDIGEGMAISFDETLDQLVNVEYVTEKNFNYVAGLVSRVIRRLSDLGGQRWTMQDEARLYEVIAHLRGTKGAEGLFARVREAVGDEFLRGGDEAGIEVSAYRLAALEMDLASHSKPLIVRRVSSSGAEGFEDVPYFSFEPSKVRALEPLPGHEVEHAKLMREFENAQRAFGDLLHERGIRLQKGGTSRTPSQRAADHLAAQRRAAEHERIKAQRDLEHEQGRPLWSVIGDAPAGWKDDPDFVYVGRAGKGEDGYFGNPFRVGGKSEKTGKVFKEDGDTLEEYAEWLDDRIRRDPVFAQRVKDLRGKHLVCPQPKRGPCHAEILSQRSHWLNHPEAVPTRVTLEATPETIQAKYDAGDIAGGQADNRAVAAERGGTPESGGAVRPNDGTRQPTMEERLAAADAPPSAGAKIRSKLPRFEDKGWAYDKDMRKADRATKFIGVGADGTSTLKYEMAYGGSDTVFTADDVVFVSANGGYGRAGHGPGRRVYVTADAGHLMDEYSAIDDAIAARASFIIDNAKDRAREYNTGERQVAAYLKRHGYEEVGDSGLFRPAAEAAPAPAAAPPPPAAAAPPVDPAKGSRWQQYEISGGNGANGGRLPNPGEFDPEVSMGVPVVVYPRDHWIWDSSLGGAHAGAEFLPGRGVIVPEGVRAKTVAHEAAHAVLSSPANAEAMSRIDSILTKDIMDELSRRAWVYSQDGERLYAHEFGAELYATWRMGDKIGRRPPGNPLEKGATAHHQPRNWNDLVGGVILRDGKPLSDEAIAALKRLEEEFSSIDTDVTYLHDWEPPKPSTRPLSDYADERVDDGRDAEPAAAPPPPRVETPPPPRVESPEPDFPFEPADQHLIDRLAALQDLLKKVTGMSDEEWLDYALKEAQKVIFNPKAAPKMKAVARAKVANIRRVQDYMKWHAKYGSTAKVAAKRKRASNFARKHTQRALQFYPDKMVAPYATSFYDAAVEQVRGYVGFLDRAVVDAHGVDAMDPGKLVDHMPLDAFERAERELAVARGKYTGKTARTVNRVKYDTDATDVLGGEPGKPKRRKAPSNPDKDPDWLRIKAAILKRHDMTIAGYDEARFVLRSGHAKRLINEDLILKAQKKAAADVAAGLFKTHEEALHEAYTALRHARVEQEVEAHLWTTMMHEGDGLMDEDVFRSFMRRYQMDKVLREESVHLSPYQARTLQKAIESRTGGPIGSAAHTAYLQSANMPPFAKGHIRTAEFQKKIGAWAMRAYDDFVMGAKSWSIDDEAHFWKTFYGYTPPWVDRSLLEGKYNVIFHDEGAYNQSMKQWGVFSRDPQNRLLIDNKVSRKSLELAQGKGDKSLGVNARRDLDQQRRFAIERYGDIVGYLDDAGEPHLTAMPWLMTPDEYSQYLVRRSLGSLPESMIQSQRELDQVTSLIDEVVRPLIDDLIERKRRDGKAVGPDHTVPFEHQDIFEISSKAMATLLADPVWAKKFQGMGMDASDILDVFTDYQRWMVLSNPGFAIMNVTDVPVKVGMHRMFRRGLYGGPFVDASVRKMADEIQPIHVGLDSETTIYNLRQRSVRDRFKDPRSKIRFGAFEATNPVVTRAIEAMFGTAQSIPASAAYFEVKAKMHIVRQMFPQVYAFALKELGDPELARLWAYKFCGDEAKRMWPTAGDHPIEKFFNRLVPFASYMVRNKVLFISEAVANPWIINKIAFVGAAVERANREWWAENHPNEEFPEYKARWIRLPWTDPKNPVFFDLASVSDAQRGWAPVFTAGDTKKGTKWISEWVRIVNPGMQAQIYWLTNALGVTQKTMWRPIYNEDGYPTGKYEKVITGWTEPWSNEQPGPMSGWWFIEAIDQFGKFSEGGWTEGEIYTMIGATMMYGGLESYDRGSALMGAFRMMLDKDKDAANLWLENTADGAFLQEWMKAKRMMSLREVKNSFADIQRALNMEKHADWWGLSEQDRKDIIAGRAMIGRIYDLYAYRISAFTDLEDRRRLKAQMYYEINRVYLNNPALMKEEIWSKTPDEWTQNAAEWQIDRLVDGYMKLLDDRPEFADYKTTEEYKKAVEDWEGVTATYLKLFPQVEKRLSSNILALEKVRDEKDREWDRLFNRISATNEQIEAAKKELDALDPTSDAAESKQLRLDALYLQNELDYEALNRDYAAVFFTPEDFNRLPYRAQGPRTLRDGITLPRAVVLPDWYGVRFKKAQREGKLDEFYAKQEYGADMQDAILYSRGGDKFGEFSPARWYKYLNDHPDFRQRYFDNNPGKEKEWVDNVWYIDNMQKAVEFAGGTWGKKKGEDPGFDPGKWAKYMKRHPKLLKMWFDKNPGKEKEWADNEEYIRRISVWGKLAQAGRWDEAEKAWRALPKWVKDKYYKNNKGAKQRHAQTVAYLAYMKRWVGFHERGDKKGALRYWNSLPSWVRNRYYAKHPDKRIEWETSTKMASKLAEYFAAETPADKAAYLRANKDLARWLAQNASSSEGKRWAILLAYRSIPKEDEWLRRVFRERYPEIFSQEAAGDRKLQAVWRKLRAHPEMTGGFEDWLKSFNNDYMELLKHQPRPLSSYFQSDYSRVNRKQRRRSLSAAQTSA